MDQVLVHIKCQVELKLENKVPTEKFFWLTCWRIKKNLLKIQINWTKDIKKPQKPLLVSLVENSLTLLKIIQDLVHIDQFILQKLLTLTVFLKQLIIMKTN